MTRSLTALLLLLGASAATAQDVPFETLAKGAVGGFGAPANHVVRSAMELRRLPVARAVPSDARLDWRSDMLLVASMGTRTSGGHSIEITAILRLPEPEPGVTTHYLEVQVARRSPPHGGFTMPVVTAPFHAVKLARTKERVVFVDAPGRVAVRGLVRLDGDDVLVAEHDARHFRVTGDRAALLRQFAGRTVRVAGQAAPHRALDPSIEALQVIDLAVSEVLEPRRRTRERARVHVLTRDDVRLHLAAGRARATGPATPALRGANGRDVELDGWLFTDPRGRTAELFVDGVRAVARRAAILTGPGGQGTGFVREGAAVTIVRVHGPLAIVQVGGRTGAVRLDALAIGEDPADGPSALAGGSSPAAGGAPPLPSVTPGLVGSVPGQ
ncbi:MAG: protease complex subunit PrcB family protein [Planctomycetes bacterium]|nr:protease complex subunit PrcB family protein [Planctomycetota bacterium]